MNQIVTKRDKFRTKDFYTGLWNIFKCIENNCIFRFLKTGLLVITKDESEIVSNKNIMKGIRQIIKSSK